MLSCWCCFAPISACCRRRRRLAAILTSVVAIAHDIPWQRIVIQGLRTSTLCIRIQIFRPDPLSRGHVFERHLRIKDWSGACPSQCPSKLLYGRQNRYLLYCELLLFIGKITDEPTCISHFSQVCLTVGLAIPLAMARRRSTLPPGTAPPAAALHRTPSGVSPALLLRRNASPSSSQHSSHVQFASASSGALPTLTLSEALRTRKSTSSNTKAVPIKPDAVLHALKAFSVATGIVVVSASATVVSFRYFTGVSTVWVKNASWYGGSQS